MHVGDFGEAFLRPAQLPAATADGEAEQMPVAAICKMAAFPLHRHDRPPFCHCAAARAPLPRFPRNQGPQLRFPIVI
jgi:hypothetical protein